MARKKSWRSGEIKSIQTFSYQDSTAANSNLTISINEVDLSHSFVAHTSAYDTGSSDPLRDTRQVFLNSSTQLVGQARNSSGGGSSLFAAGAGQVVEYYA